MPTTLDESARHAGGHQWAESRLFEILGGWVATTPEPDVRLMFDRHSHHAAWRAREWWDRLPVLAEVDRSTLCRAPRGPAVEAAERLAALEGTPVRMAGAYRFALPRLWASYDRHSRLLAGAGEVADGSSWRTLGLVSPDLGSDWHQGETALQEVLRQRADIREANDALVALEELLAAG
ncbi:MAG: hypothetical protein M0Z30_00490 [Actinomycetota bacterium]|nr:hypothetical protein [Actinomycetota bacterium]